MNGGESRGKTAGAAAEEKVMVEAKRSYSN
jgi:hypothetical protein